MELFAIAYLGLPYFIIIQGNKRYQICGLRDLSVSPDVQLAFVLRSYHCYVFFVKVLQKPVTLLEWSFGT